MKALRRVKPVTMTGLKHARCACRYGYVAAKSCDRPAFTLVEIIIVVVLLGIVAMTALPMISSASTVQIKAAANVIAADLEYAKSLAVAKGRSYTVVFDTANESYEIVDRNGNVIKHPVKKGCDYVVDFKSDGRLDRVDIQSVDFEPNSQTSITFDYLASPYSGSLAINQMNSGTITLTSSGMTMTVSVEPVTGFITISG